MFSRRPQRRSWKTSGCQILVGVIAALSLTVAAVSMVWADDPNYLLPWTAPWNWNVSSQYYRFTVTQFPGQGNHTGNDANAYDFGLPIGTPVRASRAGTVQFSEPNSNVCGGFGTPGNYVTLYHDGDQFATLYLHLQYQSLIVSNGQHVQQGAVIGLSGDTGYTKPPGEPQCGPHLHFAKQNTGGWWTASQPVTFLEYPSGIPNPSGYLTSHNHDTPTLFAHAPILAANTSPFLQLRKNATDLRNYAINPTTPPPLSTFDGWNDDPSSIHVPEGTSVRLFRDINYAGIAEVFSNWDSYLPGNPIGNDQASSLSYYYGAMLFNNIDFNNPDYTPPTYPSNNYASQEFFTGDDFYLPDNYIGNDALTSLCVGQGWAVQLYEHAWWGGSYLLLETGCYNLTDFPFPGGGTWNDRTSSVLVYPP